MPAISHPGSILELYVWSVHCSNGIHNGQGRPADGLKQQYKNPPVHRRLVGQSHIPPSLSPAYPDPSSPVREIRLGSKYGEVRTKTQTDLRICRLQVQPQREQGQSHLRMLADLKLKDSGASHQTLLSVRLLMSLLGLLTATEKQVHLGRLHMRPIQWYLNIIGGCQNH